MDFQIVTTRQWRYRHPKKGWGILDPGTYDIPEQLPEQCANLAILQGMAKRLPSALRAAPSQAAVSVIQGESTVVQAQTRRRGRPPKKKPAPENKALYAAENK